MRQAFNQRLQIQKIYTKSGDRNQIYKDFPAKIDAILFQKNLKPDNFMGFGELGPLEQNGTQRSAVLSIAALNSPAKQLECWKDLHVERPLKYDTLKKPKQKTKLPAHNLPAQRLQARFNQIKNLVSGKAPPKRFMHNQRKLLRDAAPLQGQHAAPKLSGEDDFEALQVNAPAAFQQNQNAS